MIILHMRTAVKGRRGCTHHETATVHRVTKCRSTRDTHRTSPQNNGRAVTLDIAHQHPSSTARSESTNADARVVALQTMHDASGLGNQSDVRCTAMRE